MIRRFPIVLLGIALAGMGLMWRMNAETSREGDVAEILRKRLNLAEEGLQFQRRMYEVGTSTIEAVAAWERRILDTRLLLAKTAAERIEVHAANVKYCEALAALAAKKVEVGRSSRLELIAAEYNVADAQYLLAEAKLRE